MIRDPGRTGATRGVVPALGWPALLCAALVLVCACGVLDHGPSPDPDPDLRIAFVASRDYERTGEYGSVDDLVVANADGSGLENLTEASKKTDGGRQVEISHFAWTPGGERLVYQSSVSSLGGATVREDYTLHTMRADGSGKVRLAEAASSDGVGGSFDLSPDGRRVVFECEDDICVVNADGGGFARVTDDGAASLDAAPSWLPDGRRISFNSDGDDYVIAADGTGLDPYAADGSDLSGSASPDGRERAYICGQEETGEPTKDDVEKDFEICVVNTDGTTIARLPGGAGTGGTLRWSPDGRRLAFTAEREVPGSWLFPSKPGLESDLYVVDREGSQTTRLVEDGSAEFSWSPDGKWLVYSDLGDISVVGADGSSVPETVLTAPENGYFGTPVWRPARDTSQTGSDGR